MSRVFLDTNVVVYAFTPGDHRQDRARALLAGDFRISVQVLNEFANVVRRKMRLPWSDVSMAVSDLCRLSPRPAPITLATSQRALRLAARHGFSIYDCLIIASALETGCAVLLSENMQDGQVIDETLTARNPFRQA